MENNNSKELGTNVLPETERRNSGVGLPVVSDLCQRCKAKVYEMEKTGPVNGVLFHRRCFTCSTCGRQLTLRTYFTNLSGFIDKEIYCSSHFPRASAPGVDAEAVWIRAALNAPYRGLGQNGLIRGTGETPHIGVDALHIQFPLATQTHLDRKITPTHGHSYFPAVNPRNDKLYKSQKRLELLQRLEEDQLMKSFRVKRQQEAMSIRKEADEEWQTRLKELTDKYVAKERQKNKKKNKDEVALSDGYETEKDALKQTMRMKIQKKKEALSLKLVKEQQRETSTLVQRHSRQMLKLFSSANQEEMRDDIHVQIGTSADDEDAEAMLRMLESIPSSQFPPPHPPRCRKRDFYFDPIVFADLDQDAFTVAESEQSTFTELVKQLTRRCQTDLEKARAIFRWITVKNLNVMEFDETVEQDTPLGILRGIKYGTETYHTLFLRLCSYAGLPCVEVHGHSKSVGYEPGMKIKNAEFVNTWNAVLINGDWWPIQCNWGARHLVQVKDEQTTAQSRQDKIHYEYDEHYFLTDPDEFVQEFWASNGPWQLLERPVSLEQFENLPFVRSVFFLYGLEFEGAPHAILVTNGTGGTEVRIIVPEEDAREIVFHYQLRLTDSVSSGNDLEFNGEKLERCVFHSLENSNALFSVHVPTVGSYYLEIFTSRISGPRTGACADQENAPTSGIAPFRLKCSCKFRIVCPALTSGRMQPLPECVSGEWGPAKALRNFGIEALTHHKGVIQLEHEEVEILFRCPSRLQVQGRLRSNLGKSDLQEGQVKVQRSPDNTVSIRVRLTEVGQYGVDVFVRCEDQSLHHACKYLINCSRVTSEPPARRRGSLLEAEAPSSPRQPATVGSTPQPKPPGPTSAFQTLGLRTISHTNPTIDLRAKNNLSVVFGCDKSSVKMFGILRRKESSSQGENLSSRVTMKDQAATSKKVKFFVEMLGCECGSYSFEVFADRSEPVNLYNYVINKLTDDVTNRRSTSRGTFNL